MIPALLFDVDGVLADFVRGSFRLHGREIPISDVRWDYPPQLGFAATDDPAFWNPMGREFWAGLAPLADGFRLFTKVGAMLPARRIGLLTSAAGVDGCLDGKRDWARKYFPEYMRRFYTGVEKELLAAPHLILVDDRNENVERFADEGGQSVLVPRPWNERRGECDDAGNFDVDALTEDVRAAIRLASCSWTCEPTVAS